MTKCKGCGKRITVKAKNTAYKNIIGVYQCQCCEAVQGQCYKGESYNVVKPWFTKDEIPSEQERYFDLTVLGSVGIEQRHGWFDPKSGLITQAG